MAVGASRIVWERWLDACLVVPVAAMRESLVVLFPVQCSQSLVRAVALFEPALIRSSLDAETIRVLFRLEAFLAGFELVL